MHRQTPEAFTVLGDIVRSRAHVDQVALLARLEAELGWVNEQLDPGAVLQPLGVTIGDEFQGAFATLHAALRAVLLVELRLGRDPRVRFGVGHGEIEYSRNPEDRLGQSGSAWWAARNSMDAVKELEGRRNAYRTCQFESTDARLGRAVRGFLLLRDRLLHDMDERDLRIALGVAVGEPQSRIAESIGIDPAAVTRRKYTNRVAALLEAHAAFEEHS